MKLSLLLLFPLLLHAEHHPWTRLLSTAACAVSALDAYQSIRSIDGRSIVEANPLLSNHGNLRTARMLSLKIPVCAAPFILGATRYRWAGNVVAGASLGVLVPTVIHNSEVK